MAGYEQLLLITGRSAPYQKLLLLGGTRPILAFFIPNPLGPESDLTFGSKRLKIHINLQPPYKKRSLLFLESKRNGALRSIWKTWGRGPRKALFFETNQGTWNQGADPWRQGPNSILDIPRRKQAGTVPFSISEYGQWGMIIPVVANRDLKDDVLTVQVPVVLQDKEFNNFHNFL